MPYKSYLPLWSFIPLEIMLIIQKHLRMFLLNSRIISSDILLILCCLNYELCLCNVLFNNTKIVCFIDVFTWKPWIERYFSFIALENLIVNFVQTNWNTILFMWIIKFITKSTFKALLIYYVKNSQFAYLLHFFDACFNFFVIIIVVTVFQAIQYWLDFIFPRTNYKRKTELRFVPKIEESANDVTAK